jgi:hypothetical protein
VTGVTFPVNAGLSALRRWDRSAVFCYRAEEYQQRYREKNGHATCAVTIGGQARG